MMLWQKASLNVHLYYRSVFVDQMIIQDCQHHYWMYIYIIGQSLSIKWSSKIVNTITEFFQVR